MYAVTSWYPIAVASSDPLVAIEDLRVEFAADAGVLTAVDGLGVTIERVNRLKLCFLPDFCAVNYKISWHPHADEFIALD